MGKDVSDLMTLLKNYVQATSGDDESIALSSGMSIKRRPEKHTVIDPAQDVSATPLAFPGQIQLNWSSVAHHRNYQVYSTTDLADALNPAKWTAMASVTVPRFLATGLTSGTKYAFIIITTGPHNSKSQPSEPALARVM